MSNCIDKIAHQCGTREGLQVFARDDGGVDGFCFSCKTFVRHPYGKEKKAADLPAPKVKTQDEIDVEIAEIDGYPVVTIPDKRLRKDTLEYFEVKVGMSTGDGKTPELLYYPMKKKGKITGYEVKLLATKDRPKRIWHLGDTKGCDLWGLDKALDKGSMRLIVTEGKDDAISWTRVLEIYSKKEFQDFTAVVSLPSGVSSAKEVMSSNWKMLTTYFKGDIILSFDMDAPGRQAVEDVCKVCPGIKTIDLPSKDANQCVIDGRSKLMFNSLFNLSETKNTRIISAQDIHEESKEPPVYGELNWPWNHINEETRGIRLGETIYIGAGVKMGKSEILNALAAKFIQDGHKVMMAKLEEIPKKSYKLMLGKIAGKFFHDPKKPFDPEAFDKAGKEVRDKLFFVDAYQHVGFETLKEDIVYMANQGVKAVFIDPIKNLTVGLSSAEANTKLLDISTDLSIMAKDLNIVIFLFCHLKAHDGNIGKDKREKEYREGRYVGLGSCPHELGGDIYSNQFTGSRAMMQACHMMIGVEGNKDPNLESRIRNIRNLKILEDREYGASGVFPVYWNENSSLFEEL